MYKRANVVAAILLSGTSMAFALEKTETPEYDPMMHPARIMGGDMPGAMSRMSEMTEHCIRLMKAMPPQDAAPELELPQHGG
ncbi:MAG: hypothetical protein V7704_13925 [Aurantimonas endophytica]|uniref:hypothetical protein n=1 Tax=Aurantimonas endophytica TaxID=1522175 RepID=UPI003002BDE4